MKQIASNGPFWVKIHHPDAISPANVCTTEISASYYKRYQKSFCYDFEMACIHNKSHFRCWPVPGNNNTIWYNFRFDFFSLISSPVRLWNILYRSGQTTTKWKKMVIKIRQLRKKQGLKRKFSSAHIFFRFYRFPCKILLQLMHKICSHILDTFLHNNWPVFLNENTLTKAKE